MPTGQTIRIVIRLSETGRLGEYNIALTAGQVRRIRFAGVPTFYASQGPARYDLVYECP